MIDEEVAEVATETIAKKIVVVENTETVAEEKVEAKKAPAKKSAPKTQSAAKATTKKTSATKAATKKNTAKKAEK